MHIHVRVHRWVRWWFYVGVVCGVVALANIGDRDLSRTQDKIIILIGAVHWLLGGLVCYAYEGIRIEKASAAARISAQPVKIESAGAVSIRPGGFV